MGHKPHHSLWGRRRAHFRKKSRKKGGLPKMKFSWKKAIKQAGRKASWLTDSKRVVTGKRKRKNAPKTAAKKVRKKHARKHKPQHSLWGRRRRHHHLKTGNKNSLKGL